MGSTERLARLQVTLHDLTQRRVNSVPPMAHVLTDGNRIVPVVPLENSCATGPLLMEPLSSRLPVEHTRILSHTRPRGLPLTCRLGTVVTRLRSLQKFHSKTTVPRALNRQVYKLRPLKVS